MHGGEDTLQQVLRARRSLLLVVAHIVDPRMAVRTHTGMCQDWRCLFITHDPAFEYPGEVVALHPNTTACPHMRFDQRAAYWYVDGLALLQGRSAPWMGEIEWYALFDDNTRVFPERIMPFVIRTNASSARSVYYGDFSDQGQGFACGGGGFLISRVAFLSTRFDRCRVLCDTASVPLGLDQIMDRCMAENRVHPMREHSCGTCGNRWSVGFTTKRILDGTCLHMQLQRSHAPRRYAGLLNSHNFPLRTTGPAFVHRMDEIL
jgi:hypothetical protein